MGIIQDWQASLREYVLILRSQPHLKTQTHDEAGGVVEVQTDNIHFGKPTKPVYLRAETWDKARAEACVMLQAEPFEINVTLVEPKPSPPAPAPTPPAAPKRKKAKRSNGR